MKKSSLIAIIVIAVIVIGGGIALVGSKSKANENGAMHPSSSTVAEKPADANSVSISNYTFNPTPLKVKVGTKVTWTNHDIAKHSITMDSGQAGGPDSQLFAKGESYSFTFTTAGTFKYHCSPHPYMHGVVEVTQ